MVDHCVVGSDQIKVQAFQRVVVGSADLDAAQESQVNVLRLRNSIGLGGLTAIDVEYRSDRARATFQVDGAAVQVGHRDRALAAGCCEIVVDQVRQLRGYLRKRNALDRCGGRYGVAILLAVNRGTPSFVGQHSSRLYQLQVGG